jgi:hypothetical protein
MVQGHQAFRNRSGSFAKLAAMRRASSRVSNLAADRPSTKVSPEKERPPCGGLSASAIPFDGATGRQQT